MEEETIPEQQAQAKRKDWPEYSFQWPREEVQNDEVVWVNRKNVLTYLTHVELYPQDKHEDIEGFH